MKKPGIAGHVFIDGTNRGASVSGWVLSGETLRETWARLLKEREEKILNAD